MTQIQPAPASRMPVIVTPNILLGYLDDVLSKDSNKCNACLESLIENGTVDDLYLRRGTEGSYEYSALCHLCVQFFGNNNRDNLVAFLAEHDWKPFDPSPGTF